MIGETFADGKILPSESEKVFTVPIGIYLVGKDLPAGTYSVRPDTGVSVTNIWFYDSDGKYLVQEGLFGYGKDRNEGFMGKFKLIEGYTVRVEDGAAYFSGPVRIVFN